MLRARVPILAAVAALLVVAGFVEAGRGSGGTYSLPSGNPVVSGTTITSTWANSTLQDIGTEITNSLDRSGRGAMQAPLKLTTGTSAAPALTFSSDNTTGLYLGASGDVRMTATQSTAQKWTSTLSTLFTPLTVTGLTTTTTLRVTSTSDALTVTPTATNTTAITATGTGSGNGVTASSPSGTGVSGSGLAFGVKGTATDTSGIGVDGTGGTAGYGVRGTGGSAAVFGNNTYTGGDGVLGQAASGHGVYGGATSGTGVYGSSSSGNGVYGGASSGHGVQGQSSSSSGVFGVGVTAGIEGQNTTTSTASSRTIAIHAYNGDLSFSGVSNPDTATANPNALGPKNIIKAWGNITAGGSSASLNDGFNIASVGLAASTVVVTFTTPFTDSNYAVIIGLAKAVDGTHLLQPYVYTRTANSVSFKLFDTLAADLGHDWIFNNVSLQIEFMVIGAQ